MAQPRPPREFNLVCIDPGSLISLASQPSQSHSFTRVQVQYDALDCVIPGLMLCRLHTWHPPILNPHPCTPIVSGVRFAGALRCARRLHPGPHLPPAARVARQPTRALLLVHAGPLRPGPAPEDEVHLPRLPPELPQRPEALIPR